MTSSSSASRIGRIVPEKSSDAGPGQVGRAGERDALLGALDERLQQHRGERGHRRRAAPAGPARAAPAHRLVVSTNSSPPSRSLTAWRSSLTSSSASIGAGQLDQPLLHPAGVGDHHEHQSGGRDRHQLEVADPAAGQARVLHDGDLPGELGEQPYRAVHHIVEVDRADQEPLDRPALGRRERLDPGQPVDEQPVALVGRHPAGAGVRLAQVALLLEDGHVVADGGRRDPQVVPLDEGLAADRLLGGDVVLDDRAQHLELAIVERHAITVLVPALHCLALARGECQSTSDGGTSDARRRDTCGRSSSARRGSSCPALGITRALL